MFTLLLLKGEFESQRTALIEHVENLRHLIALHVGQIRSSGNPDQQSIEQLLALQR